MNKILELVKKAEDKVNSTMLSNIRKTEINLILLEIQKEAVNYSQCCKELNSLKDPNIEFNNKDFKYSEFIQGVGKEYNYVLGNKHYFVDGELVKIL